jgi:phosphate transport system permease protein
VGVLLLVVLLFGVIRDGAGRLSWDFLQSFPSRFARRAGIKAALFGTLWVIGITALFAIPVGRAGGHLPGRVRPKNRLTAFIQTNIANLAGVPSVIYGLLGLAVFVRSLALGAACSRAR